MGADSGTYWYPLATVEGNRLCGAKSRAGEPGQGWSRWVLMGTRQDGKGIWRET